MHEGIIRFFGGTARNNQSTTIKVRDYYEYIEDYVNGNLSETDHAKMSDAIATDPELAKAVENHEAAMLILDHAIDEELSGFIEEKDAVEIPEEPVVVPTPVVDAKKRWPYLVALIAALIVAIFAVKVWLAPEQQNEKLQFADIYVEPAWLIQRGASDMISSALSAYKAGDKAAAVNRLKSLKSQSSDYWLAELYLAEQQADSVLYYLPGLSENQNKLDRDRVIYVSILASYMKGDTQVINHMMEILPTDMDPFYLDLVERLHRQSSPSEN